MDPAVADKLFASLGLKRPEIEAYVTAAVALGQLDEEIQVVRDMMVHVNKNWRTNPTETQTNVKRLTLVFHTLLRAKEHVQANPSCDYELLFMTNDIADRPVMPSLLQRIRDADVKPANKA